MVLIGPRVAVGLCWGSRHRPITSQPPTARPCCSTTTVHSTPDPKRLHLDHDACCSHQAIPVRPSAGPEPRWAGHALPGCNARLYIYPSTAQHALLFFLFSKPAKFRSCLLVFCVVFILILFPPLLH